jgi:hypothetical protein
MTGTTLPFTMVDRVARNRGRRSSRFRAIDESAASYPKVTSCVPILFEKPAHVAREGFGGSPIARQPGAVKRSGRDSIGLPVDQRCR